MVVYNPPEVAVDLFTDMQHLHDANIDPFAFSMKSPRLDAGTWPHDIQQLCEAPKDELPTAPESVIQAIGTLRSKARRGMASVALRRGIDLSMAVIDHEHIEVLTSLPGEYPPKTTTPLWHPDLNLTTERLLLGIASFTPQSRSHRSFDHMATKWVVGDSAINLLDSDTSDLVDYVEVDRKVKQEIARGNLREWPTQWEAFETNGKLLVDHGSHPHQLPINESKKPLKRVFYQVHVRGIR